MDPSAYPLHAAAEREHWWFVARRKIIEKTAASLNLRSGARVLEFGAGTGGNLSLLAGFGEVAAVELDDGARQYSEEQHPGVAHSATLAELPGTFDAAFALDVLEHLQEPAAMSAQIRERLAPGAPFVVTVPAHPWMFGQHDVYLHHVRRYTERELRAHLTEAGFTVQHLSPMNCLLFPLAVGARAAEWVRSRVAAEPVAPRGMGLPPLGLNRLFTAAFAAEARFVPRAALPFGLSLLCIARNGDVG